MKTFFAFGELGKLKPLSDCFRIIVSSWTCNLTKDITEIIFFHTDIKYVSHYTDWHTCAEGSWGGGGGDVGNDKAFAENI